MSGTINITTSNTKKSKVQGNQFYSDKLLIEKSFQN